MTYMADLEVLWRQRVTEKPQRLRSETLRGPEFMKELMLFFALTGDARFRAAIDAMAEHGIVDDSLNFTTWTPPVIAKMQDNTELTKLRIVRLRIEGGQSLARACAECAASTGHQANSFAAAIKDLQIKYKKRSAEVATDPPDFTGAALDAISDISNKYKNSRKPKLVRKHGKPV